MSRIPYITPATANTISNCVEKLFEYVNSGYPKQNALEKVASEYDLTPKQIRLVAHLYNNGLVNQYVFDNDRRNVHDSEAIIDPEPVIQNLFPKKKYASSDDSVSLWYLRSFNENIKEGSGRYENRVQSLYGYDKCDFVREITLENELKRLYFREKNLYQQYKTASIGLQTQFLNYLEELNNYFKQHYAIHPEEVKKVASLYYPHLVRLFDEVIEYDKKREYQRNQPVDWSKPPYSILEAIDDILEKNAHISEILRENTKKMKEIDKKLFPHIKKASKKKRLQVNLNL